MTRVSFSADRKSVNVKLPTKWSELTQSELSAFFKIACLYADSKTVPDLKFSLFLVCSGARVESFDKKSNSCVLRFHRRLRSSRLKVDAFDLSELLEPLDFIDKPGDEPVMLEKICGRKASVDAKLHGLSFDSYLSIENFYQGFLSSKNDDALLSIAELIYDGFDAGKHNLAPFEVFALLQWIVQVKAMFAKLFPNFFRPSNGESGASMLESMNNQIRALTGGDVVKEAEVFATDCWRALTELDYKAKEAEEFKRQMAKSKSR